MMDLHVHIYDLETDADDNLIEEIDVNPNDVYDGFNDGTDYVQYIVLSQEVGRRSIEIRIPIDMIKPELLEQLKESWKSK